MKFLKDLRKVLEQGNIKKNIYNYLALAIICVIILISWSIIFPKKSSNIEGNENIKAVSMEGNYSQKIYEDSLETQLANILSKIEGVGEVEVMITYETSAEVVPAVNITKSVQTTEENDKQGGTRKINQENITESVVTVSSEGYVHSPIVIKEIKPIVRGVIVVAEGAQDPRIKNELVEAVTTIFQIKSSKVKVYGKE